MKRVFKFILITVILIVGIVTLPSAPSPTSPSVQQGEALCQSTVSSEVVDTTVSFVKSGLPTHFEATVYTTETGKKYHSAKSCPGLSNAKEIYETPLKEAKEKGLTECLKCY